MNEEDTVNDDNEVLKKIITGFLVGLPMLVWLGYVIAAALVDHGPATPPALEDALRLAGVASGAALATIAGSFLGIASVLNERLTTGIRLPNLSANGWATLAYFVGLLIAVGVWIFDPQRAHAADVIQTSLATLIGFGLGALKAATTDAP